MLNAWHEYSTHWPLKIHHFDDESCEFDSELDVDTLFTAEDWRVDYLYYLKQSIDGVKEQLNDKDIEEWGRHTSTTDACGWVIQHIKTQVDPVPEILTRAWIKFWEIIHTVPVVDPTVKPLTALFLCEAPGAFVSATNHFIHSQNSGQVECQVGNECRLFKWRATSLNPYHEMSDTYSSAITDDRLIRSSSANWFFGQDNTGNIFSTSFMGSLSELIKSTGKFDLVTGDGGTCHVDTPGQQVR